MLPAGAGLEGSRHGHHVRIGVRQRRDIFAVSRGDAALDYFAWHGGSRGRTHRTGNYVTRLRHFVMQTV